jgi:hypothetical protein
MFRSRGGPMPRNSRAFTSSHGTQPEVVPYRHMIPYPPSFVWFHILTWLHTFAQPRVI